MSMMQSKFWMVVVDKGGYDEYDRRRLQGRRESSNAERCQDKYEGECEGEDENEDEDDESRDAEKRAEKLCTGRMRCDVMCDVEPSRFESS
ncbi:hypothetical protein TWF225_007348 [Orbilia oligospora]|uniref:Uncharacterized protein n=1 Tax=Orbilia oligospora TaxID=2813651 RepID=A0A7C8K482_ORBOL|nr:hypothetical protein TWF751_010422 [Orbilia oligospora]KAF3180179.1 hypothetical protein TWF225_007348 [Orbilia oligospora]KAF3249009.1 hypothetical protein TWF217_008986 [Orbilia oligospora]KAF3262105.1 hypothetical protein TWF128_002782 [Orbilia oligospora]KAF3290649.1 hypothetical protein TWF132_006735 [Orbilia oligospora]